MTIILYLLSSYWAIGIALSYYFLLTAQPRDYLCEFNCFQKIATNLFLIFVAAPIFPYVITQRQKNSAFYNGYQQRRSPHSPEDENL
jgi:hypothetical protein